MYYFACQQRNDETNYQAMPITHKNHLTDRRDQHSRKHAGNKPIEHRLRLSFQAHLAEVEIFHTEGKNW